MRYSILDEKQETPKEDQDDDQSSDDGLFDDGDSQVCTKSGSGKDKK